MCLSALPEQCVIEAHRQRPDVLSGMRAAQAQAYGPPAQKISTDTGNEQLAEGCQYAAGHVIIAGAMDWALLGNYQEMNAGHSIWHIQVLLQLLSGQCCERCT